MKIQRCVKCKTKFKYIDILESVCWGYKHLTCRECGAKYTLKMRYLAIVAILLSIPIFFIDEISNMALMMSFKIGWTVLFYVIYIAIILGLYPFFVRYNLNGEIEE